MQYFAVLRVGGERSEPPASYFTKNCFKNDTKRAENKFDSASTYLYLSNNLKTESLSWSYGYCIMLTTLEISWENELNPLKFFNAFSQAHVPES